MKKDASKIRKLIKGIIIGYILGVLIIPYIKVEILTYLYGKEFDGLDKQTNMLVGSEYYKVFSYDSKHFARVYYIDKDHTSRNLITFTKEDGAWKLYQWDTIWSSSGSADSFMWPYYR